MNRRGHLSTKIPQVKLRPAPARAPNAERESSPINKMDEEILRMALLEAEDGDGLRSIKSPKPLRGVCITFTGVENKAYLGGLAKELGAQVETALTKSVTHVVAVGFDSPKYHVSKTQWLLAHMLQFAVEHRIPIMTPEWIKTAHKLWINAEEFSFEENQENHRLLPFLGLKISMSGIEKLDRRKLIIKYITANGGEYHKDLDHVCTHLISSKPTSDPRPSEKLKWALRENAEVEAWRRKGVKDGKHEIIIVYEEWIWDCVAYKGRWKEDRYDARKPRRGGKVNPDDVINGTLDLPEIERKVVASSTVALDTFDATEPVSVRRRKRGQDLNSLVGEIVPTTGDDSARDTLERQKDDGAKEPPLKKTKGPIRSSMVHLSRTGSFAIPETSANLAPRSFPIAPVESEKTSLIPEVENNEATRAQDKADECDPICFKGLTFANASKGSWPEMENALTRRGATIVSEEDWRAGVKCQYAYVRMDQKVLIPEGSDTEPVTENWVEACANHNRILSTFNHISFRPLDIEIPIPGSEKLHVHLSGSEDQQTSCFTRRLARALGVPSEDIVHRGTTHLVSIRTDGIKVRRARTWGAKIVKHSWLWAMAKSGKIEPWQNHELFIPPENLRSSKPASVKNTLIANSSAASEPGSEEFDPDRRKQSLLLKTEPSQLPKGHSRALITAPTLVDQPLVEGDLPINSHVSTSACVALAGSNPIEQPEASTRIGVRGYSSAPAPRLSPFAKSISPMPTASDISSSSITSFKTSKLSPTKLSQKATAGSNKTAALKSGKDKNHMTEALRQLAEGPNGTPGHVPRRSRPSARIKNTRSPAIDSPNLSPSKLSSAPIEEQESIQPEDDPLRDAANGNVEESMKISYIDQNSERERNKLMALFGGGSTSKRKR
ncbi:uncharacterized protein L203_100382 [Cryptococcus depauperatus CBS 7841]|uniref:BRCT domain-containing protein n=1 Tax=Cryptococcus depauperatus CBS 7841 TaxID=1295531 RepID=A0AAJ8JMW8_9TREE